MPHSYHDSLADSSFNFQEITGDTVASIAGLYVSYSHDLPTGASIVCTLGTAALLLAGAEARFSNGRPASGPH